MKDKKADVIKYIIENKNEELNINAVSKGLKMDYKNVHAIIQRLEKEALVDVQSFGKSSRVKLVSKVHPLIFEAEYNRKEELLKDKNLAVMLSNFKKALKSKFYVLLVFGSYAAHTQTKKSDIDLMFIVPDGMEELFEKDVHRVARLLPLPIHYLVFSDKQFLEMVYSREPNVGQEALKNNIILQGIENYYEMV